jgi:hypothetical protein
MCVLTREVNVFRLAGFSFAQLHTLSQLHQPLVDQVFHQHLVLLARRAVLLIPWPHFLKTWG